LYPGAGTMISEKVDLKVTGYNFDTLRVQCPFGYYLQGFGYTSSWEIQFTCVKYPVADLSSHCISSNTEFNDYHSLDMLSVHRISCSDGYSLTEFVGEFGESSKLRFVYKCCDFLLSINKIHIENATIVRNNASYGG
jgi:hypothetical protein